MYFAENENTFEVFGKVEEKCRTRRRAAEEVWKDLSWSQ